MSSFTSSPLSRPSQKREDIDLCRNAVLYVGPRSTHIDKYVVPHADTIEVNTNDVFEFSVQRLPNSSVRMVEMIALPEESFTQALTRMAKERSPIDLGSGDGKGTLVAFADNKLTVLVPTRMGSRTQIFDLADVNHYPGRSNEGHPASATLRLRGVDGTHALALHAQMPIGGEVAHNYVIEHMRGEDVTTSYAQELKITNNTRRAISNVDVELALNQVETARGFAKSAQGAFGSESTSETDAGQIFQHVLSQFNVPANCVKVVDITPEGAETIAMKQHIVLAFDASQELQDAHPQSSFVLPKAKSRLPAGVHSVTEEGQVVGQVRTYHYTEIDDVLETEAQQFRGINATSKALETWVDASEWSPVQNDTGDADHETRVSRYHVTQNMTINNVGNKDRIVTLQMMAQQYDAGVTSMQVNINGSPAVFEWDDASKTMTCKQMVGAYSASTVQVAIEFDGSRTEYRRIR